MDGVTYPSHTREVEIRLLMQNNDLTKFDSTYDSGLFRFKGNTCLCTAQRTGSDKIVRGTFPMRYEIQKDPLEFFSSEGSLDDAGSRLIPRLGQ